MVTSSAGDGRRNRSRFWISFERLVGVARVDAVQLEVAGDVRAAEAEVAGRGQQVGQAALGGQVQPVRRVLRAGRAAVVRREPERAAAP